MKICLIANGNSDHTQIIANYFTQSGNEVHLISHGFRKGYDPRIEIHQLKQLVPQLGEISSYLSFLLWVSQTKKMVAKIKPDIVNGHYVTVYGFLASLTKFHPLVVTAWGSDVLIQPRRNPFWRLITKYALKKADLFTCLFDVEMLSDEIGKLVPIGLKTASLPHGIDTSVFVKNRAYNNLRQSYGIAAADPIIINIRGLDPIFDPVTFIRAMPLIVDKFPSAKFLVTYEKERKDPYEELIRRLHMDKNVIIQDFMPSSAVAEHLGMADIYVSTSLSDGASNALFEGMSCELPPVVTDIPANRCWIKDGENGFLFKPGDHVTLAEKIIHLLNDKQKRETFGRICRGIVKERAEFKIQMAKTEKMYREFMDRHPKR